MAKIRAARNRSRKNTSAVRSRIFISRSFARFCADFKIPHTPHRNAVAVNAAQKMAKSKPNAPSGVTAKRMRQRVA